jgi:hypothetical protein
VKDIEFLDDPTVGEIKVGGEAIIAGLLPAPRTQSLGIVGRCLSPKEQKPLNSATQRGRWQPHRDRFDRTACLARSSSPSGSTTQSLDLAVSETLQERAAFTAFYDARLA